MSTCWRVLTRKKVLDPVSVEETRLSRVLNTFDLTALGVGSTLGVGVYVIAGHVAKETAGPAVVLSFLIAAVASVFAGLCYAEFGARVPRAGSAYVYSYVCVGEFVAFVIGWNLILEYVIGSASVARGLSLYLDMLINNTMQKAFIDIAPIGGTYLSAYFDFFAFGISILLAAALAFGLKESSLVNNIFTTLNILVVLFVVIAGSFKADAANWSINPNSTHNATGVGDGGFFPFGVEGMMKGAATCFYGFVGFDCIATTGEEVKNPRKAIPISIITSLFIIFLAYLGTSTVITLMVPYYLQDSGAPLPYAFDYVGWDWAKWIASLGGIFGQCASLFGAMFPLPRILYAMASDSLVFKFLGKINARFQTPVIGTLLAGLLTGLMAGIFKLKQLVDMMSLGTFLAYTIVAASVLILRYAKEEIRRYLPLLQTISDSDDSDIYTDQINLSSNNEQINEDNHLLASESSSSSGVFSTFFNSARHENPTKTSETIVRIEVLLFCIACVMIALCARFFNDEILDGNVLAIVLTTISTGIAVILLFFVLLQPTSKQQLSFKVPFVPLIPALSIMINIYLMVMLDSLTWIRFAVWMVVGLPIYCFSVRLYTEAENKNVSEMQNCDTPKQNGDLASYVNEGFEEDNGDKVKKILVPLLPPVEAEDKEIHKELEKLDEMLEAVANNLESNRRMSVDSVSVCDVNVPYKENVVAVIHCDNVITPAASDADKSFFSDQKNVNDDEIIVENELYSKGSDENEVDDSPLPPDTPVSYESEKSDESNEIEEKLNIPDSLPPQPAAHLIPSPENLPPQRPTSAHLASVTLKPPKTDTVDSKETTTFEPDDNNLRVGSDKYRAFIQNLDEKLKRITVIPTYIPFITTKTNNNVKSAEEKVDDAPNENVIRDNLDRNEAKEKMELFITSRLQDQNKINREKEIITPKLKDNNILPPSSIDDDFIEHKNRMNNVFRSMNIKHVESLKDPETDKVRNSKSLGFANDDKANHRMAMSDIFKTIESRRNDSKKED